MRFYYDNSFYGLLTLIFEYYKYIEQIVDISVEGNQINLFSNISTIETNDEKAQRVEKGIIHTFGYRFFQQIFTVYLSSDPEKELVIAKVIKNMYTQNKYYLESADVFATKFRQIHQKVRRENHAYKGLLRFDEYDGVLIAKIEPINNLLYLLVKHFKNRLKNEKFIIADVGREIAAIHSGGNIELIEFYDKDFKFEDEYKDLWQTFYKNISIKERKNEKLRISNMPKKYWKRLHELGN